MHHKPVPKPAPKGHSGRRFRPQRGNPQARRPSSPPQPATREVDYSIYKQAPVRQYKVVFYDNFPAAKADAGNIKALCSGCDQLNVVIKAEGNMDDPELLAIDEKVKIFAGTAWALIHERRVEEGWYNGAH